VQTDKGGKHDSWDKVKIYTFLSTKTRLKYVVRAEFFGQNLVAIKFYAKTHKRKSERFNLRVNRGNAISILLQTAELVPLLLQAQPDLSFVIAAQPTIDLKTKTEEPDSENQRYRIYKGLLSKTVGNQTFTVFDYPEVSLLLLVNKNAQMNVISSRLSFEEMLKTRFL
jgi:hypothetical protein